MRVLGLVLTGLTVAAWWYGNLALALVGQLLMAIPLLVLGASTRDEPTASVHKFELGLMALCAVVALFLRQWWFAGLFLLFGGLEWCWLTEARKR